MISANEACLGRVPLIHINRKKNCSISYISEKVLMNISKIRFCESFIISNFLKISIPLFHIFENKVKVILISLNKQSIIPNFKNP